MNGRAYDYNLGRFYGVDPFIQFPSNSQSLNPYSYLMNNPLAGTDPTGYAACAAVSTSQTNTSGSCTMGGQKIGYSFNGNGDVAIGRRGASASQISAAASVGVLSGNPTSSVVGDGIAHRFESLANGATRVQTWASPSRRDSNDGKGYTDKILGPAERRASPGLMGVELGNGAVGPSYSISMRGCEELACAPQAPAGFSSFSLSDGAMAGFYPEAFVPVGRIAEGAVGIGRAIQTFFWNRSNSWMSAGAKGGVSLVDEGVGFIRIGSDAQTLAVSQNAQRLAGFLDVVIHGNREGQFLVNNMSIPVADIAAVIRSSQGWQGQSIRLVSCHSGACGQASALAKELAVKVIGPTERVGLPLNAPLNTPLQIDKKGIWNGD